MDHYSGKPRSARLDDPGILHKSPRAFCIDVLRLASNAKIPLIPTEKALEQSQDLKSGLSRITRWIRGSKGQFQVVCKLKEFQVIEPSLRGFESSAGDFHLS